MDNNRRLTEPGFALLTFFMAVDSRTIIVVLNASIDLFVLGLRQGTDSGVWLRRPAGILAAHKRAVAWKCRHVNVAHCSLF